MTDLVTGEAVVLDLRLAKLASRALALALDVMLQMFVLVFGLLVVGGLIATVDEALASAIGVVFALGVIVGYPVAFETLTRGRTLGKIALGLRVVRDDGGPVRFRHAFVRGLVGLVEIWVLWFTGAALIASLASKRGKRLGDLLAGTVVVHERVPVRAAPMVTMPPALGNWALTLDLSRVPDDLALAARQYLARMHELSPEVRDALGARLAHSLAAVTSPPPPRGAPAWAFLAAVVAERRRRELLRLQGTTPPPGAPAYGAPAYGAPAYGGAAPQPAQAPPDLQLPPQPGSPGTPSPQQGPFAPPS